MLSRSFLDFLKNKAGFLTAAYILSLTLMFCWTMAMLTVDDYTLLAKQGSWLNPICSDNGLTCRRSDLGRIVLWGWFLGSIPLLLYLNFRGIDVLLKLGNKKTET